MRAVFFTLVFLVVLVAAASAQDQKFKFMVTGSASEVSGLNPIGATDYQPNIGAELMGTVGKAGPLRFSAGINFINNFETEIRTYHVAGQISYHKSVFEPFARFSAGVDKDTKDTTPGSRTTFSRNILLGVDLNFGRFSARPFGVGFKRRGEFLAPAERTFQTGVGFNF